MNSQTDNVIVMAKVESLHILLTIIHYSYCCNMVNNFSILSVKQIIPAIIAPVTEEVKKGYIAIIIPDRFLQSNNNHSHERGLQASKHSSSTQKPTTTTINLFGLLSEKLCHMHSINKMIFKLKKLPKGRPTHEQNASASCCRELFLVSLQSLLDAFLYISP